MYFSEGTDNGQKGKLENIFTGQMFSGKYNKCCGLFSHPFLMLYSGGLFLFLSVLITGMSLIIFLPPFHTCYRKIKTFMHPFHLLMLWSVQNQSD